MPRVTENMSLAIFYKLLQCLHHLSLMRLQEAGQVRKAFALKLSHLNDFIKPANATDKIRYHVDQINKAWVKGMTNILIFHYEASITGFIGEISTFHLNSNQVGYLISKTLDKGVKRYGKKLTYDTIREFRNILSTRIEGVRKVTPEKDAFRQQKPKRQFRIQKGNPGVRSVAGAHDPLSNFFLCQFIFRGRHFRSIEHAYQWERALFFGYEGIARRIEMCRTASEAKQMAREIPHSDNWDRVRISFMRELLRLKWEQVPVFRKELLASNGKSLEHTVPDVFWGKGTAGRHGKNTFGWLLESLLRSQTGVLRTNEPRKLRTETKGKKKEETPVKLANRFSALSEELVSEKEQGKGRTSAWSVNVTTRSPISSGDFPELPKSQRPRRSTRKVLNLTNIESTPTQLKRGPPSPGTPPEGAMEKSPGVSPPHKRTITDCCKGCFPAMVRTHTTDKSSKKSWAWPKLFKDTLIIGEENVSRITAAPVENLQMESYPGARFQHFTDMLKDKDFPVGGKCPRNIIISLGLNDRSSDPQKTSIRNLKTMLTWMKKRFESSDIFLTEINFSKLLPKAEQTNLEAINRAMGHSDWATVIPKLPAHKFKVVANSITGTMWREDTANAMLSGWVDSLN